ncbi:CAP domain-containing protein [Calothrix sp. CCY 0018]|uniref:CAP domain-containing protein n=1 Tax=Calothrix sp. CCY 0018 TaxID=3103864 RepID=UPI0039C5BF90
MTISPDSNLEATTSETVIDEPIVVELENPALPEMPLSCDSEDSSPIESDTRSTSVVQEVVNLVNNERRKAGLSPLRIHSRLNASAQAHSNDMARNNFMSHTGSDGSSMGDRIKRYGYNFRRAAENVAAGQSSPQDVMRSWMNSPGHRKNILNGNFRDIGVGYARGGRYGTYWTQNFGA